MKTIPAVALAAGLSLLAACDRAPPSPGPAPAAAPAIPKFQPGPLQSSAMDAQPGVPSFSLDRIGAAFDPYNRKPAVTPQAQPILLSGFGFDGAAQAPARGVDIAIDGKPYPTAYGQSRPDVVRYTKNPALLNVGFTGAIPAGALDPGEHIAVVRVVAADGSGYFESPQFKFEVR